METNTKEIGKVIHFFDHIMVAVIRLQDKLTVGDKVRFVHNGEEFEQDVESIEIDHKQIKSAQKGDEAAIKVVKNAHANARVYKIA